MVSHKLLHFVLAPCINGTVYGEIILSCPIFNKLVCTESFLTFLTVHKRVCKSSKVSRCHPCLRIHEYRTVHAYIIRTFLNKFLPPCLLDIVLKLNTKISVVPCIGKSTVYLRTILSIVFSIIYTSLLYHINLLVKYFICFEHIFQVLLLNYISASRISSEFMRLSTYVFIHLAITIRNSSRTSSDTLKVKSLPISEYTIY